MHTKTYPAPGLGTEHHNVGAGFPFVFGVNSFPPFPSVPFAAFCALSPVNQSVWRVLKALSAGSKVEPWPTEMLLSIFSLRERILLKFRLMLVLFVAPHLLSPFLWVQNTSLQIDDGMY